MPCFTIAAHTHAWLQASALAPLATPSTHALVPLANPVAAAAPTSHPHAPKRLTGELPVVSMPTLVWPQSRSRISTPTAAREALYWLPTIRENYRCVRSGLTGCAWLRPVALAADTASLTCVQLTWVPWVTLSAWSSTRTHLVAWFSLLRAQSCMSRAPRADSPAAACCCPQAPPDLQLPSYERYVRVGGSPATRDHCTALR